MSFYISYWSLRAGNISFSHCPRRLCIFNRHIQLSWRKVRIVQASESNRTELIQALRKYSYDYFSKLLYKRFIKVPKWSLICLQRIPFTGGNIHSHTYCLFLIPVLRIRSMFFLDPDAWIRFLDPDAWIRFLKSGSMDPVFKIRIRVTQKRPDPTGSKWIRPDPVFNFLWHFLSKFKHLSTL